MLDGHDVWLTPLRVKSLTGKGSNAATVFLDAFDGSVKASRAEKAQCFQCLTLDGLDAPKETGGPVKNGACLLRWGGRRADSSSLHIKRCPL
jgi:hypothetical protein